MGDDAKIPDILHELTRITEFAKLVYLGGIIVLKTMIFRLFCSLFVIENATI